MRDVLLATAILALGFGFTLTKLAYDEWCIWKENKKPKGG